MTCTPLPDALGRLPGLLLAVWSQRLRALSCECRSVRRVVSGHFDMLREVRPRPRRFVRARFLVLFVFLVVISPAIYSYTTTMLRPSSLPLGRAASSG